LQEFFEEFFRTGSLRI